MKKKQERKKKMPKLVTWPSKVKFSRGPSDDLQHSSGGKDGETVEVPQIEEDLSAVDFFQALINLVGTELETKQIVNKQVLAYPAIREGQQKFKGSHKKTSVQNLEDATKEAIIAVREYVPTLTKERGAVVTEAFQKASKMDALQAARMKVARKEMTEEDFFALLEETFAVPDEIEA